MSSDSIAIDIAKKWGLAGSSNLVLWGLLAVLLALLLGIGGGWWVGDSLQEGQQAKAEVKQANQDNAALNDSLQKAHATVLAQRQAVADSSKAMEDAIKRLDKINLETARERDETRKQFASIRADMQHALANRPDLRDVRVGSELLDVWNAANRGQADAGPAGGAAGAAQPAAVIRPGQSGAVPRKPAGSPRR